MSTPILPAPIATYFTADRQSADAVAQCFIQDAVVYDEGHTYTGRDAIKAWKQQSSAKYTYTSEPLSFERRDERYVVRSKVAGDFPGSPVVLQYHFALQRDLIASLQIST